MLFPFHDDNPVQRFPFVTIAIVVANVLSLAYMMQLGDLPQRQFIMRHGFLPARVKQLTEKKGPLVVDLYPEAAEMERHGQPLPPPDQRRLVLPPVAGQILMSLGTSLFMHAGIMHLVMNMWFFWIFGNNIEDRLGHVLFLLFYLVGGLLASMCHWLMTPENGGMVPVIGASGAVAVTLGAYAVTYPMARVKTFVFLIVIFTVVELPALVVLGVWFFGQILQAHMQNPIELGGGVAWWAHIGGFISGAILMPLLAAGTPEPGRNWEQEARDQFQFRPPSEYS